jgi:hypothetical protein
MLSDRWWFWALTALVVALVVRTEPRWRRAAAAVRARALRRRIVAEGAGAAVEQREAGPWSEVWLPGFAVGLWVCAGPWIWGYDDVDGAIVADVVTGGAIAALSIAGVVFPALLALNVLAGLWLVTAPWLVGYGDHGGPVGLSDSVAGVVTCALALRGITVATRRLRAAAPGPIGRVQRPSGPRS